MSKIYTQYKDIAIGFSQNNKNFQRVCRAEDSPNYNCANKNSRNEPKTATHKQTHTHTHDQIQVLFVCARPAENIPQE